MFIFIDRMTVTGDLADYQRIIGRISEHMAAQPGFRSHRLYRNSKNPLEYVEIAEWENAELHKAATGQAGFREPLGELLKHATVDFATYEQVSAHDAAEVTR
ncbi:antibiotic biosynthesis monooxygenase family protein [Amycolatopsis speibonae]|uniref:Antibiotic biosynthesis monooxygenase family protein n=1 Tax=Amycolatopsis speibonae TaxID=1450224 RepID=A0ABV7NQH1_9PSEU